MIHNKTRTRDIKVQSYITNKTVHNNIAQTITNKYLYHYTKDHSIKKRYRIANHKKRRSLKKKRHESQKKKSQAE